MLEDLATDFHPRGFGSDNHSGVHPELLDSIIKVNNGHLPSYGTDKYCIEAEKQFKKYLGENAKVFFVFNGTAANTLALKTITKSFQSIISSDVAHLNVDECAAPETIIGSKILTIQTTNGKITTDQIKEKLIRLGDQHYSQAKVISITQPTELGTVYSLEELKRISQFAKEHDLYLHIDGARFSNACVALNCSLKDMIEQSNVDVLSFGGTKNGLMFGEAVIFFNSTLAKDFKYIRKQGLNLPSKSRFIAAQFIKYFTDNLWLKIATHSVVMAKKLEDSVQNIPNVRITQKVQSNAVFAKIPKAWLKPLRKTHFFYVWDQLLNEDNFFEVRWITSFDTTEDDITSFTKKLNELSQS